MLDTALHIGVEHPNAIWILVSSLLSFTTGAGFGIRSNRLQNWLRPQSTEAAN